MRELHIAAGHSGEIGGYPEMSARPQSSKAAATSQLDTAVIAALAVYRPRASMGARAGNPCTLHWRDGVLSLAPCCRLCADPIASVVERPAVVQSPPPERQPLSRCSHRGGVAIAVRQWSHRAGILSGVLKLR